MRQPARDDLEMTDKPHPIDVHVGRRLRDLLVVSRMLTVFDAYDSEDEALASFTRHPLPGETRKDRASRAASGKPA